MNLHETEPLSEDDFQVVCDLKMLNIIIGIESFLDVHFARPQKSMNKKKLQTNEVIGILTLTPEKPLQSIALCHMPSHMKTRPSALGMSDPVMEFLGILETQEFPIILKLLKGTKGA